MNNNINEEVWKDAKGYEGLYKVSSHGRVWTCRQNRVMKQRISKGYSLVSLTKDGVNKKVAVHRLVAKTFIPNNDDKREVNHKDEDKLNNNINNLMWATSKENANWGTRNKRIAEYVKSNPVKKEKPIEQICAETGIVINRFPSVGDALKHLGLKPNNGALSRYLKGIRSTKTYKGYKWRYSKQT